MTSAPPIPLLPPPHDDPAQAAEETILASYEKGHLVLIFKASDERIEQIARTLSESLYIPLQKAASAIDHARVEAERRSRQPSPYSEG